MILRLRFPLVLVCAVLWSPAFGAPPVNRAELEALRARVRELEAQLRAIAQRLDESGSPSSESGSESPIPAATSHSPSPVSGFPIRNSESGTDAIRLHGLVQLDSRVFLRDADAATDTFTLRRARLISDGVFARNFGFQFVTEFGGNDFSIRDANLTVQFAPSVQLKAGKFKTPVGLDLLQQSPARPLIERSIVSSFVPNRDLGLQLGGEVLAGTVNYAVGVFNGITDGEIGPHTDRNEDKDVAARIMMRPFHRRAIAALNGLSAGVGGARGRHQTPAGHLPTYRSDGQQVFFAYGPAIVADGDVSRVSPQFDYRNGPLAIMGEYVVSSARVRPASGGTAATLRHRAWQVTSSWVLTGEDSSYLGLIPRAGFNLRAGTWGAFEVVARYSGAAMAENAFPVFAAPETNARDIRAMTLGLNWHLTKVVRFMFNYTLAEFDAAVAAPLAPFLRTGERLLESRLQLAF